MTTEVENIDTTKRLLEIVSFVHELDKFSSKKEVALALLTTLYPMLRARFCSFVERERDLLNVVCQIGENNTIKNIFSKKMCEEIFEWVTDQRQLASLKLNETGQFVFLPLFDQDKDQIINHGMLVFHLTDKEFEFKKELSMTLNVIGKLASLSMTKFLKKENQQKYLKLQEEVKSELQLVAKLQKSMSGSENNNRILFNILDDERTSFNGNIWWISELGVDITLVLMAQILCKGSPSALLSGYLLGEMNSLKTRAEISLKPQEVLRYLNQELNPIFKSTGITVNAWYGVFNIGARKVRFANANYPDPFLIGPEQQVSNLILNHGEKGEPIGVSLDSTYQEGNSSIPGGSKLIIFTRDLLEQASKVGDRYDTTWLPQVLETLGALSLGEMTKSLKSILSENGNGTGHKASRLALLLEIPS